MLAKLNCPYITLEEINNHTHEQQEGAGRWACRFDDGHKGKHQSLYRANFEPTWVNEPRITWLVAGRQQAEKLMDAMVGQQFETTSYANLTLLYKEREDILVKMICALITMWDNGAAYNVEAEYDALHTVAGYHLLCMQVSRIRFLAAKESA